MKFAKRLRRLIHHSLPDWRDKYLSYKSLKQSLKLIPPALAFDSPPPSPPRSPSSHAHRPISTPPRTPPRGGCLIKNAEAAFLDLLNSELDKVNTFFLEKEEEYVIRLQEIKGRVEEVREKYGISATACSSNGDLNEEIAEIRKDIVNVHGEMVLLENYSALNYTGLVKIIKKHDKRTGALLRIPFIQSVLQEPFFATDIVSKLVRECEENLKFLFPSSYSSARSSAPSWEHANGTQAGADEPSAEVRSYQRHDVETICRNTEAALNILKEFGKGSSTYNVFSIPPFSYGDIENGGSCRDVGAEVHCCEEVPVCSKF